MAQAGSPASYAKVEDATLRKVLALTLDASSADARAATPVVHLAGLEQELLAEAGSSSGGGDSSGDTSSVLLLGRDNLERALLARLSEPPAAYPQWPVHYLIGVYSRATEELRSVGRLKEQQQQAALAETLQLCRQLAVSYAGLILTLDMFPQVPEAEQRGALQLLDSLDAAAAASAAYSGLGGPGSSSGGSSSSSSGAGGAVPMPPGFLEDFASRFADEGLPDIIAPIMRVVMKRSSQVSLLGDIAAPFNLLMRLAAAKPLAKAITQLDFWLPPQQDGRTLEYQSLLGPLFAISSIPDTAHTGLPSRRLPDVAAQCFSGAANRRPGDVKQSMQSIQMLQLQLRQQLHALVMLFLKNQDTREAMLAWLAAALDSNVERTKMRPDPKKAATDGFMLNLAGVLLRLCEPFIDPLSGKAWGKLDVRFTCDPAARLHTAADVTRLNATSEEVEQWFNAAGAPPDGKYHFICECFFMAARALQLGLKKGLDNRANVVRTAQHWEEDLEGMQRSPDPMTRMQAARMPALIDWLKAASYCYEASFQDQKLLAEALAFYRLSAAYMLRLASPTAAAGGPPTLPLPDPPAKDMCMLPEYFVEDLGELLLWVGRVRPDLVEGRRMEEFMVFFTVFLGSPAYVKNAYLRGKMVEALHSYMPPEDAERQRYRVSSSSAEVAMLFEVHSLVIQHMVSSLVQLYIDIEITDRHNTFYEKFNTRFQIGEILSHLWNLPQHRASWRQMAQQQPKLHVQFIHIMLNDSQHLLQEALDTLPKVQETQRLQADAGAWARLSPQDQQDREANLHTDENRLKNDFYMASVIIRLMQVTAEDRAVAGCYFDDAVRTRTAKINNFFLKYLVVPEERKKLRVNEPEKYNWHPKKLITQLSQIHLNLYRARRQEWVQAVAADTDYYGRAPQLFTELTSMLLRPMGLLPEDDIRDLERMAAEVETYKASVQEEEDAFEDVPEEYEDPLLGGVMQDPVQLPSGTIVERSSIVQQLLTDPRDPYSRQRCTEEDLVPLPELKNRIDAWVREQRGKRMQLG